MTHLSSGQRTSERLNKSSENLQTSELIKPAFRMLDRQQGIDPEADILAQELKKEDMNIEEDDTSSSDEENEYGEEYSINESLINGFKQQLSDV